MPESCEICQKVGAARTGQLPFLIHEFEHSFLVVGDHQLFPGYCVLHTKEHAREPFDLPPATQATLFQELMTSAKAIHAEYQPWKINYGCYGNQVPHVHWHIFPRYESDPARRLTPWAQSADFDQHLTSGTQAREVIARVKLRLLRV
jgi:diadenosine tetraphosphate (Ap4A) HIT family hydrolase